MKSNGLIGRSLLFEVKRKRITQRLILTFVFGLIFGFILAKFFYKTQWQINSNERFKSYNSLDLAAIEVNDIENVPDNNTLAQNLSEKVRVLCWIMTNPDNHLKKALHVKRTWGKRCNKLLFMSSKEDETIGSIALNVSEGRNNLWAKTKEAFKYVYRHHLNDAEWFLKADDDTYTIVENLRFLLYRYSPETPIYFGCKFKPKVKQGYMSGGAGYVLSKEALRRFVEEAIPNPKLCYSATNGAEDIEIGKCLENVNVIAGDSRDHRGRGRFFPFIPEDHLLPHPKNDSFWYWKYIYYDTDEGLDCCSDYAISFHYIKPNHMYVYDYLIYHLRPYGLIKALKTLPEKLEIGETEPPPMDPIDGVTDLL